MIKVTVPATSANLGIGYDTLGMAVSLYSHFTFDHADALAITGCPEEFQNEDNMVYQAFVQALDAWGLEPFPISIHIETDIPVARGLGSSSTCVVAGIMGAAALARRTVTRDELVALAAQMEGHPDNVAPALFGGITISAFLDGKLKHISFVPKFPLKMVVAIPDFYLSTKKARSVLKQNVPLKDAIFNIGHIAMIIGAFSQSKPDILKGAFDDRLHQPYRADLIPGMYDVFEAADKNGALGTVLSGAGPTLIAYTAENGEIIGQAMVQAFAKHDVKARYMVLDIDSEGAKII